MPWLALTLYALCALAVRDPHDRTVASNWFDRNQGLSWQHRLARLNGRCMSRVRTRTHSRGIGRHTPRLAGWQTATRDSRTAYRQHHVGGGAISGTPPRSGGFSPASDAHASASGDGQAVSARSPESMYHHSGECPQAPCTGMRIHPMRKMEP